MKKIGEGRRRFLGDALALGLGSIIGFPKKSEAINLDDELKNYKEKKPTIYDFEPKIKEKIEKILNETKYLFKEFRRHSETRYLWDIYEMWVTVDISKRELSWDSIKRIGGIPVYDKKKRKTLRFYSREKILEYLIDKIVDETDKNNWYYNPAPHILLNELIYLYLLEKKKFPKFVKKYAKLIHIIFKKNERLGMLIYMRFRAMFYKTSRERSKIKKRIKNPFFKKEIERFYMDNNYFNGKGRIESRDRFIENIYEYDELRTNNILQLNEGLMLIFLVISEITGETISNVSENIKKDKNYYNQSYYYPENYEDNFIKNLFIAWCLDIWVELNIKFRYKYYILKLNFKNQVNKFLEIVLRVREYLKRKNK